MSALTPAAFAKTVGVRSHQVRRAIKRGRLTRGLAVDAAGRAMIVDPEAARAEWTALAGGRSRSPAPSGNGTVPMTPMTALVESRRSLYAAQRERIEQALAERREKLVSPEAVGRAFAQRVVVVRTRVLGVPSRLRQRFPDLEPAVLAELDRLLREALEAAAAEPLDGEE